MSHGITVKVVGKDGNGVTAMHNRLSASDLYHLISLKLEECIKQSGCHLSKPMNVDIRNIGEEWINFCEWHVYSGDNQIGVLKFSAVQQGWNEQHRIRGVDYPVGIGFRSSAVHKSAITIWFNAFRRYDAVKLKDIQKLFIAVADI